MVHYAKNLAVSNLNAAITEQCERNNSSESAEICDRSPWHDDLERVSLLNYEQLYFIL